MSTLQELIALRANLTANALWLAGLRLHRLFGKAGSNPKQPRVPRGFREGGQWTREGGPLTPTTPPKLEFDEQGKPKLPATRPDNIKVRNSLSRQVARWVARRIPAVRLAVEIMESAPWLYEEGLSILSDLDPPQTLEYLQYHGLLYRKLFGRAPPGYQIHHIVEQKAAASDGFPEALIQSWENQVVIPKYRHEEITTWFGTRNSEFGGLSPRQYLVGRTWDERYRLGLRALKMYGVLKP